MHCHFVSLCRGLGVALGVLSAALAFGQPGAPPPAKADKGPVGSVHRMVILQGPNRSVHYITSGNLSTADRLAAFDLAWAENELAYASDLQRLKQLYVANELTMEPRRLYVQEQLYGTRISYGGSSTSWGNYYPSYPGYTFPNYMYPYGFGGYGYGGGFGYGGGVGGARSTSSSNVVRSLQYGMGDEGRIKTAMAPVIANQTPSEYAAATVRNYQAAADRAANSPVLSRDLSLTPSRRPSASAGPTFTKGSKVTIWVGNDKYVGTVSEDRGDWVVLKTDKAEVTVRKSGITRSEVPSKP